MAARRKACRMEGSSSMTSRMGITSSEAQIPGPRSQTSPDPDPASVRDLGFVIRDFTGEPDTQAGAAQSWTFDVLVAFAYLVVFGSCVGLVLQLWLTRRLRPTTMTLSQLLISAQALIVGAVALGESITWRMLVGAALVAIALILNALSGGGERAEAVPVASPAE